jgi:hypothetical protein
MAAPASGGNVDWAATAITAKSIARRNSTKQHRRTSISDMRCVSYVSLMLVFVLNTSERRLQTHVMRKLCHILVFDTECQLTATPILYNSALRSIVLAVTSLSAQESKRNQRWPHGQYREVLALRRWPGFSR